MIDHRMLEQTRQMNIAAAKNHLESASPIRSLTFVTGDGYRLSGIRYPAAGKRLGNIVVAGATGVQQVFYRRFALHAASREFDVLTFDYRGVGQSKVDSLKDLDMSFLDWGRYDLSTVVDAMYDQECPLFLVGHSYGGQAVGLLPNHQMLTAAYSFGAGAGWTGWMNRMEAIKVHTLWRVILPVIVKWKGYMAWSTLGMGDDLPVGVYREWKRWCQYPHYFFDDPAFAYLKDHYASVAIPYVAATSTDDKWAPPKSRDAFCQHYTNCDLSLLDIEAGIQRIGHMGYFRESAVPHWDRMLDWFLGLDATSPALSA